MIPRKRLDISWADLFFALSAFASIQSDESVNQRLQQSWANDVEVEYNKVLACLSVRSGFDALLTVLDLNPGDEVLVSAITIPGMLHIIEAHGLVPVPLDIDMERLSVAADSMATAVSGRTKMILVAHLFGSRMQMEPIVGFAKTHNLFIVEDCAQAYQGDAYRGHLKTDVCLFSFGPIKTATALGGGLLCFQSDSLCETVR
ncbi:MAG: aminotransferase class I/II-fold pyridoxal phosphate-dependent enzyme, partial [Cyanobacteria bacterium J06650_10]